MSGLIPGAEALLYRPDWWDRAECRGTDPEVFHPQRKVIVDLPGGRTKIVARSNMEYNALVARATRYCESCRTTAECEAYAIETRRIEGVYAGHYGAELREVVFRGRRRRAS